MEMITLMIPDVNWEGLAPTAAQVIAASTFWDVHGYRPVLHPADMFPHECERCRAAIAVIDARRAKAKGCDQCEGQGLDSGSAGRTCGQCGRVLGTEA